MWVLTGRQFSGTNTRFFFDEFQNFFFDLWFNTELFAGSFQLIRFGNWNSKAYLEHLRNFDRYMGAARRTLLGQLTLDSNAALVGRVVVCSHSDGRVISKCAVDYSPQSQFWLVQVTFGPFTHCGWSYFSTFFRRGANTFTSNLWMLLMAEILRAVKHLARKVHSLTQFEASRSKIWGLLTQEMA